MLLSLLFYLPMTLLAPLSPASAQMLSYTAPTPSAPKLNWPNYGGSAIGAVGFPGTLATSGDTQPRSIASLSKVITTLVVLEKKPLAVGASGPLLTMTMKDVNYYIDALKLNGQVEPVRPGLTLTQFQVLNLVLVPSANNYAESLVNWAFGSPAAYLSAVHAWLIAHGLTHTTMLDPSGLNPGNTSTTADLIKLGKLALANPLVSQIIATKTIDIPGVGVLNNTNALLGIDGVDGIKTGTLDQAGACLLFAAKIPVGSQSVTVVGVILGGKDHVSLNQDVTALLASVERGFHEVKLSTRGQPFVSYTTRWGQSARAVAASSQAVLVWGSTPVTAKVSVTPFRVDSSNAQVGQVRFTVGTQQIVVPLQLDSALKDPGPWWRLANPFSLIG